MTEALVGELVPTAASLPAVPGDTALARATAEWLDEVCPSPHSRRAYQRNLAAWLGWCAAEGVHPRDATRSDVAAWHQATAAAPTRTGRPPATATLAQQLYVIASWYDWLADEDLVEKVPIRKKTRRAVRVDPDSSTTQGLDAAGAKQLLAHVLDYEPLAHQAVVLILLHCALRSSELCGADWADLGWDRGHRTLTVTRKGNKKQALVLSAAAAEVLDELREALAAVRGIAVELVDGPLCPSPYDGARLTNNRLRRLMARIKKEAGLPAAFHLTPHGLRHTAATLALDAGATLADVQDLLGHASPRTTRRYDCARGRLDRSPTLKLAAALSTERRSSREPE